MRRTPQALSTMRDGEGGRGRGGGRGGGRRGEGRRGRGGGMREEGGGRRGEGRREGWRGGINGVNQYSQYISSEHMLH